MHRNKKKMLATLVGILLISLLLGGCYSYSVSGRMFTPVPTLPPAEMPDPLEKAALAGAAAIRCKVRAVDLLGAWVTAGIPEEDAFSFTSEDGEACTATFYEDVQSLFQESNLWFEGAAACVSCHYSDLENAFQRMDLSSYEGILAGAQRESADAVGMDILGGGVWEDSRLYEMLITKQMPLDRPQDTNEKGPLIYAGAAAGE
jgi:hypothetical protein